MHFTYGIGDIPVPVEEHADSESAQVVAIFWKRRRDDVRASGGRELDEQAAHAAGGSDDEHGLVLGEAERVEGGDRRDPATSSSSPTRGRGS